MANFVRDTVDSLRKDKVGKKVLALVIFAIIILVFVFFGMPQKLGLYAGGSAATVNNIAISVTDWQQRVEYLERYQGFLNMDKEGNSTERLRFEALQQLIQAELIAQASLAAGIHATDEEVRQTIVEYPQFQKDGKFQQELYRNYLKMSRMSPGEFEIKIRYDILQSKIRQAFQFSGTPNLLEKGKDALLKQRTINVKYVEIDAQNLPIKIAENEVKDLADDPKTAQEIANYYEQHQSEFMEQEKVRASHILVSTKDVADKDAKEKINTITKRLDTEDFNKVAKEVSDDPGSKDTGGELGYITRGQMVPEFENAAFSAEIGKLVGPVKTAYGYHLIKVTEKRAAVTASLEQVKLKIARRLLTERKNKQMLESIEISLQEKKVSQIENTIKTLGLKWEETGAFTLESDAIPKIGENEDVFKAAFQLQNTNDISPQLVNGNAGKRYIIKLIDSRPAALEDEKNLQIETQFRSYAMLNSWYAKVREKSQIEINHKLFSAN